MSDSLQPHESQHARPPCPSPTPGVYSNSCSLSQWCHPAISSSVVPFSSYPLMPPSIRVFSNESAFHMRWPKCWNFSFSISPSNEHPGLISFRMDWLDLLADQGTLKSLLQHHYLCAEGRGMRESLYFLFNFDVNLKLLWKCSLLKMCWTKKQNDSRKLLWTEG